MKIEFKNLQHKKIWTDSMIGMTWGFLTSLIIGTIIGLFGLGQQNSWSNITTTIKAALTYLTPFAIGIGVGIKAKLSPVQIFAVAIGAFIVGQSLAAPGVKGGIFHWNYELGIRNPFIQNGDAKVVLPGDVFAAWIFSVSLVYIFTIFKWKTHIDIIIVPIIGFIIGVFEALWLTYLTSTVLVIIEWVIDNTVNKKHWAAILLAPVIGALMGLALALPTSSAAIAAALSLKGDAATAAIAGTSAMMIGMGVLTFMSTKNISFGLAVGFGSAMLQMKNFSKKPIILISMTVVSAITALISVAAVPLTDWPLPDGKGQPTSGMGTSALYGQIFTLKENGWTNLRAWMNVIFMQLLLPALLSISFSYVMIKKLKWIKDGDMVLKYE